MLAVDASFVVSVCLSEAGFDPLGSQELVAPPLVISETSSALHELRWRGAVSHTTASAALERLLERRVSVRRPARLWPEAWSIADRLGWAKTYDAEYVALARLLGVPLVTVDARLRRGAGDLVQILRPTEL